MDETAATPYRLINVRLVRPMPGQPRVYVDPQQLEALAGSVREFGQAVPITVVPRTYQHVNGFMVIDGHRRLLACLAVGAKTVKAVVESEADPEKCFARAVAMNMSRVDNDPAEVAVAFARLAKTYTTDDIARMVGVNADSVRRYLRLNKLVPDLFGQLRSSVNKCVRLSVTSGAYLASFPADRQKDEYGKLVGESEKTGRSLNSYLTLLAVRPESGADDPSSSPAGRARGRYEPRPFVGDNPATALLNAARRLLGCVKTVNAVDVESYARVDDRLLGQAAKHLRLVAEAARVKLDEIDAYKLNNLKS